MSRSKYYDKTSSQWVHSDKSGLPANVFPTFDDLRINNGTELQIKASATGKTLGQCELGETVYLPETINGVKDFHEYIVVEKNGEDNVVLLRKYVASGDSGAISQNVNNYVHGNFYASGTTTHYADNWCETTFINRFSTTAQNYITTKVIKIISNSNGTTTNFQRKAFLPSVDELGGTPNIGNGEGTSVWFTTGEQRIAYIETDKTNPIQYWTRTLFSFTVSSHNYYHFSYVNNTGGFSEEGNSGTVNKYYRPAVVFLPSTPLNGSNQFIDEITYTDTIDTIKFGDNLYDLKDQDARAAITDLETEVDEKAAASHTHVVSDITDFPSIPTAGTITSGSTGYATGGDVYNAINKPPYDIGYFADANVIIDDTTTTSGLTISNQTFVVYQDMNTLLSKVNTYKSLNICGGFTTDMTQSMGYNFIAPATISHIMPVPNAVAAQLIPDIGTKDAIAVRISPIYRQSLFVDTWGIYEDTNGEVKTVVMNN